MNQAITLPILLVSNSSTGRLLDFLNVRTEQLRHTTSLRTALSVLENYPAKILILDLPIDESKKLIHSISLKNIASIVLVPKNIDIESISGTQLTSWIVSPFKNDELEFALENTHQQMLDIQRLQDNSYLAKQLERAFESSAIVSKTNPKGIITYANHSFEEISGYTKDELIGKPHNIVRHPEMPKSTFAQMWETIKQGQIWKGIIKNRRKDGSTYIVESTIVPILNSNGVPVEYMGIRHDITPMANQNIYLKDVAKKMKR